MFLCFYKNCEESTVEDLHGRIHNLNLRVFKQYCIKEQEEEKNESLRILFHTLLVIGMKKKKKKHFMNLCVFSYSFSFC